MRNPRSGPARLTMVMGVQRSGTTALLRSLAHDPQLASFEEGEGPLFGPRLFLRPERESRQFLRDSPRPILIKPLNETKVRGVDDVLEEFAEHDPRVIWIYRDPVNVFHSWTVQWPSDSGMGIKKFVYDWNARNQRLLSARRSHGSRIVVVRYEDLVLDPDVWCLLSSACRISGEYGFRPDGRAGRRVLTPADQELIDAETQETWDDLEGARTWRPGAAQPQDSQYRSLLREDDSQRRLRGRAADRRHRAEMAEAERRLVAARSLDEIDGLFLWLDAGTIPAAPDRTAITRWPARCGTGAEAGGGPHGAFRTISAANGRPAVHFPPRHVKDLGGAAGFRCGPAEDWSFLYDGSPWTVMVVYRTVHSPSALETAFEASILLRAGEVPAGGGFVLGVTGTSGQICGITTPLQDGSGFSPVVMSIPIRIPGALDGWRVATCVHQPAGRVPATPSAVMSYVGQQLVNASDAFPGREYVRGPALGGLHVGSACGVGLPVGEFSGDIAEVAVFTAALGDHARMAAVRYLSEKYCLA